MEMSKEIIKQAQASDNENLIYFAYIIDNMYNLYEKKNRNYGNSFGDTWKKLGPISGVTRLSDKLNRAISLVTGTKSDFESLEDTFIDLANYAVMCEVELLKEKFKEDEKEAEAFQNYIEQAIKVEKEEIIDNESDLQNNVKNILDNSKKHAGKKILVENK